MRLVADTHVHLYPHYNRHLLFCAALENLRANVPHLAVQDALFAICLTERSSENAFAEMSAGDAKLQQQGWIIEKQSRPEVLKISHAHFGSFLIFAGCQIRTAEKLEVLCLGTPSRIPDGQSLSATLRAALSGEAVVVLPWSPGKWTGARAGLVRSSLPLLAEKGGFLGDIYMRARGTPENAIFEAAHRAGVRTLAGSDPLPVSGEERVIGRYGIESDLLPASTIPSLKDMLGSSLKIIGKRSGFFESARRYFRNFR